MKQFKNSSLVRKQQISQSCYDQIMKYFSTVSVDQNLFFPHLKNKLIGYYSSNNSILLNGGTVSDKCWFINEGMVIAYYYDHKEECATFAIFGAGETAILPDSFMTGQASKCYLMACPGTHLLEINASDAEEIYELFPDTERLTKLILAHQWQKYQERDQLLRYDGKERVREFFKTFPMIRVGKRTALIQKAISSYLMIKASYLSKLRKEIEEEEVLNIQ